jgi:outer membrane protein assembly factor BamB
MELLLLIAAMTGCSKTGPVALPAAEAPAPTLEELAMHNPAAATTDWPIAPNQDDWPWWRGLNQDGRATPSTVEPPLTWGPTENVVWRTPLSGRGHASPVLWGETLLLANADEEAQTQSLLALSRMDGKPLWSTVIHRGELPSCHPKNSHASATPACDGRQVYAAFVTSDGLWVTALNFAGEIAWQSKAGPFSIEHGYGSSPVLYESLVIVAGDNQGPGYLASFDRATGEMVWRTPRTEHSSYGTPILATLGDRAQLLHSGGNVTAGYDPKTGQQIWKCAGPTETMANTMAIGKGLVYASGGYPDNEILCIRADDSGGSAGEVVWRTGEGVAYVPSPLVDDGRLYVVNDNGILTCFAAESGTVLWKKRLGGDFTASPVAANGRIYIAAEDGTTHVIASADKFQSLAKNVLGEEQYATPSIAGGRIYVRTTQHLYCFGHKDAL